MDAPEALIKKQLLLNVLEWFRPHFRQVLLSPIESQFPNLPLTREIQDILNRSEAIMRAISDWPNSEDSPARLFEKLSGSDPTLLPLFKRIVLLYRRHRAAITEPLTEKAVHLELVAALEEDVKALDALIGMTALSQVGEIRLPRLKDYLPVQHIESATVSQAILQPRQYDEKFHILQAPHLFLPDMGYFRTKCEDRNTPLTIAFIDIDDFKSLNTRYTETKVDRNLLPRFMQAVEAHVFHHGYAYRQGGDEYLILLPSLSRPLSIGLLDELRCKLADLPYPDMPDKTTVSIGLCHVEPDCPLTDRELLDRANRAKQFAKQKGKNCIATYNGSHFTEQELEVVATA